MFRHYRVFLKEFWTHYHTTGAIAPSGPWLAASLSRFVEQGNGDDRPRRILEVGPGTGAVTQHLVTCLRPRDTLDLVELNDSFVEHLQHRFSNEPAFQAVVDRTQILHQPVNDVPGEGVYDLIISGLPLNNFSVADVEGILATYRRLLAPGGTLSFFEYMLMRPLKLAVTGGRDRERIRGISRALGELLGPHRIKRDWIWPNMPPAWVHHVRLGEPVLR